MEKVYNSDFVSKINCVSKNFKEQSVLKEIYLDVKKGEIIGLLGENGSGKTTTIKIMTGRISPNQGSVTLFGVNPIKDYKKIAHRISVVGEEKCLYDDITVAKNLEFFSKLYDCNPKAINEAVKFFELEEVLDKKVSKLSTGYKQRVVLARAIIHDPDIIFLDEPSLGLDPHIARKIRDKIKELNKMGKTIFLTTHYLDEAEYLCDRIVVLKNGNISQPIEINQLKESYGSLANYYMKVYED